MAITPQQVEERLLALSKEIDTAHAFLEKAEYEYHDAKTDYELKMAKERLSLADTKMRVQDVQDIALTHTQLEYKKVNTAEATVKSARANATRIRTQVDIARSVGTSVRTEYSVS